MLTQNWTVIDEVCVETYSKNVIKRWSRKAVTDISNSTPEREIKRERQGERFIVQVFIGKFIFMTCLVKVCPLDH